MIESFVKPAPFGARDRKKNHVIPRIYLVGVWSGLASLIFFMFGLWPIAGFVPPHPPMATAGEIVHIYQTSANSIRLGMVIFMTAAAFWLPWTVTISAFIRRMEGESRFLSQCQLLGGLAASMFFILPALIWQVAAFRPDRSPDLILLLNDAAWLFFVTPVPPFLIQFLPIAAAILMDKKTPSLLPRWLGFATLWATVAFLPALAAYFLKTGPFAWDGLFSFWIPLTIFGIWQPVVIFFMLRAIKTQPTSGKSEITAVDTLSTRKFTT